MASDEIYSCMFCRNNCAPGEFEDHLRLHYHLCFRCAWCKNDQEDGLDPVFVYYGVIND